jgi:hypothetical protein
VSAKRYLGKRFPLARSIHPDFVTAGSDLAQAPSINIASPDGFAFAREWVERTAQACAWITFFTHDVSERPSPHGTTPGELAELVRLVRERGFEVLTEAEGLRRIDI